LAEAKKCNTQQCSYYQCPGRSNKYKEGKKLGPRKTKYQGVVHNHAVAVSASGKANLQCCSDKHKRKNGQWVGHDFNGFRKDHGLTCTGGLTWAQTKAKCESVGMRLCTKAEACGDEGAFSGCNFDQHRVWTSDQA